MNSNSCGSGSAKPKPAPTPSPRGRSRRCPPRSIATIPRRKTGDELPPGWHWLYFLEAKPASELGPDGHPKRGGFLPPVPLPRRMWAGGRIEFLQPLRIGDAIRRDSEILSVEPKHGRSGSLVFVTVRHTISAGQAQPRCAKNTTSFTATPPNPATAPPPGKPAPAHAAWQREPHRRPGDAVPLFGAHLQRPPHPLRSRLRKNRRTLSRPDRARPAANDAAARFVPPSFAAPGRQNSTTAR